jgi:hypothetical protein
MAGGRHRREDAAPQPRPGRWRHPLHRVSAWATDQGLVLGQVAVADKSNEIVDILDLDGAVVTIDAMGCQKSSPAASGSAAATTCWR